MMISNLPVIGVRFDIDKIPSGSYGVACWKIFWHALPPEELRGALLFEGDTAETMNGGENVYCIAIQGAGSELLGKVKTALSDSEAYRLVCARPNFVEGIACMREPLPAAGRIDQAGNLLGDAWNSKEALMKVRRGQSND